MSDASVFLNNSWGDKKETLSGSGSTKNNTQNVRKHLPPLLKKYSVASLFDAPCGDGNWIQHVDLPCEYSGGDLVQEFVDANPPAVDVKLFDIRSDTFPSVDLWLCRACWYHLCFADIKASIDNWLNSDIKYLLVTTHEGGTYPNDIVTGGFRRLNLYEHDYFGLPDPIDQIPDVVYGGLRETLLLFQNPNL